MSNEIAKEECTCDENEDGEICEFCIAEDEDNDYEQ